MYHHKSMGWDPKRKKWRQFGYAHEAMPAHYEGDEWSDEAAALRKRNHQRRSDAMQAAGLVEEEG